MATKRKGRPQREPAQDVGAVQRAIRGTITGGEIISVGVLNLVRNTLITAVSGARDVGSELGLTAVATVRGAIRAAYSIGGDLGTVARSAARGAVWAAGEVGGDVGAVARKAIEGTIQAAQDIGDDVGAAARKARQGAIEAADRIGAAAGRAVRLTVQAAMQSAKRVEPAPRSVKSAPRARRASLRPGSTPCISITSSRRTIVARSAPRRRWRPSGVSLSRPRCPASIERGSHREQPSGRRCPVRPAVSGMAGHRLGRDVAREQFPVHAERRVELAEEVDDA